MGIRKVQADFTVDFRRGRTEDRDRDRPSCGRVPEGILDDVWDVKCVTPLVDKRTGRRDRVTDRGPVPVGEHEGVNTVVHYIGRELCTRVVVTYSQGLRDVRIVDS